MSERVLHEWEDCGHKWSVQDDEPPFSGDPVICRDDKEIESGVIARELARLAARVVELIDPREHAIAIDDLSGQIERLKAIADALREEIRARDVAIAKLRAERPIMCSPVERWEER